MIIKKVSRLFIDINQSKQLVKKLVVIWTFLKTPIFTEIYYDENDEAIAELRNAEFQS